MAYYDDMNDIDFSTEEEKIKRARVLADSLRGIKPGGMTDNPGFTSAVTGTKVVGQNLSPGKWSQYAPLIGGIAAPLLEGLQDDRQKELNKRKGDDLLKYLGRAPKPTEETNYEPLDATKNLVEAAPVTRTVPATDAARMQWAGEGVASQNPLIKDAAQKSMTDLIVNEPVREEARADKLQAQQNKNKENALTRLTQIGLQQDRNNARLAQIQLQGTMYPPGSVEANRLRAEALQIQREGQALKTEKDQRQLEINQQTADAATMSAEARKTRAQGAAGGAGGVKPTYKSIQDQAKVGGNIVGLTNVLNNLNDSMFNPLKHSENTQLVGAHGDEQDQKDSANWASYRAIVGEIRNQLYGSALTAHEQRAFDATSMDTTTGKKEASIRLARMIEMSRVGLERQKAMMKGGEMDPETGEVIMPDGTVAEKTKTRIGPDGTLLPPEKKSSLPRANPPAAAAPVNRPATDGAGNPTVVPPAVQQQRDAASIQPKESELRDAEAALVAAQKAGAPPDAIRDLQKTIEALKRDVGRSVTSAGGAVSPERKAELKAKYGL